MFVSVCAASEFRESNPEFLAGPPFDPDAPIGREVSVPAHLSNGQEFELSVPQLLRHGELLFLARWTSQEGQGRAFGKGNDGALTDPGSPLVFPRNFNRISGPAAGACFGCHNMPRAGGGDVQGPVFVLGNRFDFATFDRRETAPTKGAFDETGRPVTLQTISNPRKSTGMFGSGFVEMLARQITADLKAAAAGCAAGQPCALRSKGIDFGTLTHRADGTWDVSQVVGLPAPSLRTTGTNPPSLVIQPFFQSGAVISLRQFSNNAFTRLHGMQSEERFGNAIDQDRDGYLNDLTRADLPQPRLRINNGVVMVPVYTDLKLHDITTGLPSCAAHPELINTRQCDGDVEALDQNEPAGTPQFFAGNRKFITRKLWGIANQHSFGHHGQYTTLREAVLAHAGEAAPSSAAFRKLDADAQNALIEFLKSLQILPPGTSCLVVDENYACGER
jgi:hypothetical protein